MTTSKILTSIATTRFVATFITVSAIKTSQTGKKFVTVTAVADKKLADLNKQICLLNNSDYIMFGESSMDTTKVVFSYNLWFNKEGLPTERIKYVAQMQSGSSMNFGFDVQLDDEGEFREVRLQWDAPVAENSGQDKLIAELKAFANLKSEAELAQEAKLQAMIEVEKAKLLATAPAPKLVTEEQKASRNLQKSSKMAALLERLAAAEKAASQPQPPVTEQVKEEADA